MPKSAQKELLNAQTYTSIDAWLRAENLLQERSFARQAESFLHRFNNGNDIATPALFGDSAAFMCAHAIAEISTSIVNDPTAEILARTRLASLSILLSNWSCSITLPTNSIIDILNTRAHDYTEIIELAKLCEMIALSKELWKELGSPVVDCLKYMCEWSGYRRSPEISVRRRLLCKDVASGLMWYVIRHNYKYQG